MDLVLNNLQKLICHKTKPNQTSFLDKHIHFIMLVAYFVPFSHILVVQSDHQCIVFSIFAICGQATSSCRWWVLSLSSHSWSVIVLNIRVLLVELKHSLPDVGVISRSGEARVLALPLRIVGSVRS